MNDAIDLVGSDTRLHCFRTNGKDLCCKLNKGVRCEEKNNNKEEQQRRKEISYTSSNSRLLDLFRGVLHDLRRLPELLLGVTLTGQRECIVGSWNVRWHLQEMKTMKKIIQLTLLHQCYRMKRTERNGETIPGRSLPVNLNPEYNE